MNDIGETKKVLSTTLTPLVKGFGIALPALGVVGLVLALGSGEVSRVEALLGFGLVLVAASWLCWFLLTLARVSAGEADIEVSVFAATTKVRYGQIIRVTSHHALAVGVVTLPLVTLTVREEEGHMKKVRFIARTTFKGWVGGVHPDVLFLKAKAGVP